MVICHSVHKRACHSDVAIGSEQVETMLSAQGSEHAKCIILLCVSDTSHNEEPKNEKTPYAWKKANP